MPQKVTLSDFSSIWIQWTDHNVHCPSKQHQNRGVSQWFGGTREHSKNIEGNMSPFFGNRGTKLYKCEDENIVSKFIKRGTNYKNMWEHGNIGQFWKRTRAVKDTPWESLRIHSIKSSGGECC